MAQEPSENIGVADAYLRLWGGLTLLALGAGRKLGRIGSFVAVLLGASKVAEGITRYCPVYDMMDLTSLDGRLRRRERETPPEATSPASFVERSFPWDDRHGENTYDGPGEKTNQAARAVRRARPAVKLAGKRASERKQTTPETSSGVARKSTGIAPDDRPRPVTGRQE